MENIIHISDSEFQEKVLASPLPVIVDFWAEWCPPCKMIAPTLEEIASEHTGGLIIAKVNTDENPERAMEYGVMGIPTLLFIAGGKVIDRQMGASSGPALKARAKAFVDRVVQTNQAAGD
jgi:thioredoxin 1